MLGVLRSWAMAALLGITVALAAPVEDARAASASEIDARANLALQNLLAESETARVISDQALAVLIFPDIVKAGLGVGGQYGEGALRRGDATAGYYNIASASFGLQAGAQSYSQVMFFMTREALELLDRVKGFEIGADASVAVASEGVGVDVTTSTLQDPIIAFVFGQKGLMAGVSIEGSKISRIQPN